jgi:hypothetical protein
MAILYKVLKYLLNHVKDVILWSKIIKEEKQVGLDWGLYMEEGQVRIFILIILKL